MTIFYLYRIFSSYPKACSDFLVPAALLLLCLAASAILIDRLRIPSLCETRVLKVPGDKMFDTILMSSLSSCSSVMLFAYSGWGNGI